MEAICLKSKGFGAVHMQRISTIYTQYDLVLYIINDAHFCILFDKIYAYIRMQYLHTVYWTIWTHQHTFNDVIQHQN